ncbi:protein kinase C delta type-like [Xenopus laevis]|uniref:Protein kinase C delta type-like n=1 Tax=Xenopus laevis TaxID=8355 RepID=A0A8J1KQZ4_XENLA|nr:protein kinase C delta type-like [Xenopus laevis]
MEYASGGSLHELIGDRQHLEEREVIFYSAEMVCGLQYLHSRGIIHRDIKPGNVLLSSEGHVKLADFGVAAAEVFGHNTIHGQAGTLNYMAPEMLLDRDYTAAVDWWSFGVTLCKMTTGKSPFQTGCDLAKVKKSILKDQPNIPGWISSELRNLLRKLLKKKPHKRLGINGSIRHHPFYASIDWEELESMGIPPPFQPEPESSEDLNKVTPSFMEVLQNPSEDNLIEGLSYINPSWKE